MTGGDARFEQQRRYFFEPLVALAGGSLRGRRVLDAGCGDGAWTLQALAAGAEEVLAVDERAGAIEHARRRFEQARVEAGRVRLEHAPVPGLRVEGSYDIALCIGTMERTARPVELFELFAGVGAGLVVIDTALSGAPSSFFELSLAPPAGGAPAAGVALVPSREAVVELAAHFGYDCVPLAHQMGAGAELADYRAQRRVAFVCASEISLDELPWEEPPLVTAWWRALLDPSLRGWQAPA